MAITTLLGVLSYVLMSGAPDFDNSCLLNDFHLTPPTKGAPTTWLEHCPGWVVNTTDAVWNLPESRDVAQRNATLEKYFYQNWTSYTSWGAVTTGMPALQDLVASTLSAFPDLKIHITDVFCYGNDIDGYKTVMPDVLTGTNTGASGYGPATGRKVKYGGTAITYVQRVQGEWVYVAEWLLHDEWSLISQLGFDDLTKVPHKPLALEPHDCLVNTPGFGWSPTSEYSNREQLTLNTANIEVKHSTANGASRLREIDPVAKATVKAMDALISAHTDWNNWAEWSTLQKPFWTEDLVYDTVYTPVPNVLNNSTGLREWYDHEHIPFNLAFKNCSFNQMIFAGDESTATTTTYGIALWYGDFAGIQHTGKPAVLRICDFYQMAGPKIRYNWMMLDMVDVMLQAGHRVLPKPHLREQWVQPPRAMDGLPAPLSLLVTDEQSAQSKALVSRLLKAEWQEQDASGVLWDSAMIWYGPVGFGVANGLEEYLTYFLKPLHSAFDTPELQVDVLSCQGNYCGAHGYLHADHTGEWLGEPASGKRVSLRFGMHWHVSTSGESVLEGYAMFDLPAFFIQIGVDLYKRAQS